MATKIKVSYPVTIINTAEIEVSDRELADINQMGQFQLLQFLAERDKNFQVSIGSEIRIKWESVRCAQFAQ